MLARGAERWRAWIQARESSSGYLRFLAVFMGIWCIYDFLDLLWGGTDSAYWLVPHSEATLAQLKGLQIGLLIAELLVFWIALRRRGSKGLLVFALGSAFFLRAIEAQCFFSLNDFFYSTVTVFILCQFCVSPQSDQTPRWPREVLRYQTAWIYFATALLKLNPHWLSGDHLWIRLNYMSQVLAWPFPAFLARLIALPQVNHWLAIGGAVGEMSLAILLVLRAPRWLTVGLAVAMHGFAAFALNVWFFGASMIAQVAFVGLRYESPVSATASSGG